MSLNVVLLDDERHVIDLLDAYCKSIEGICVIARFTNPVEALNFINTHDADVLISDINMPSISGIELAQSLTKDIKVVFITAHNDFAVDAFDLDVVDYIKKPVLLPRFIKAISKVKNILQYKKDIPLNAPSRYIFVKDGGIKKRLVFDDILFLHAQGDYTEIYLKNKTLLLLGTLSTFQQSLPENEFVRVHRSYIVNKANVDTVDKDHLIIDGHDITIGKTYRQNIDALF